MSIPELGELGIGHTQSQEPSPLPSMGEEGGKDSDGDYLDRFLESEEDSSGPSSSDPSSEGSQEETFYDASKVPPELQATFREMQGSLTKKTQSISEIRKQYESELQGLGSVKRKAQVMDQLLRDQRFIDFVNAVDSGQETWDQEDSSVDPSVRMHLTQALSPVQQRLSEIERRIAAGQELAQLAARRPDYRNYQSEILEAVRENPNRTLEDAYNAAVMQKLDLRRGALSRKKAASMSSVEGAASTRSTAPVTEVNSIRDAFAQARQMLKLSDGDIGRMSMPS